MKLSPEYRALINELLTQEIDGSDGPNGIDKQRWHAAALARLETEFPQFAAAIAYEARAMLLWQMMTSLASRSKHPYLIRDREQREIEQRAKFQRSMVQVPIGGNAYMLKRFMDCTKREVALVIDYYERQKQALEARIRWYREVYEQMDLLGLGDESRVSDVVTEEAA